MKTYQQTSYVLRFRSSAAKHYLTAVPPLRQQPRATTNNLGQRRVTQTLTNKHLWVHEADSEVTHSQVKAAMKRSPKSARVLQRILNARQFCLKLIANVTYGYTAAGFSGRMPCAELADSIVQARGRLPKT